MGNLSDPSSAGFESRSAEKKRLVDGGRTRGGDTASFSIMLSVEELTLVV